MWNNRKLISTKETQYFLFAGLEEKKTALRLIKRLLPADRQYLTPDFFISHAFDYYFETVGSLAKANPQSK